MATNSVTESGAPVRITPAELLAQPWTETDLRKLLTEDWMKLNPDGIYMSGVIQSMLCRNVSKNFTAQAIADTIALAGLHMRSLVNVMLIRMRDDHATLMGMPLRDARKKLDRVLEFYEHRPACDVIPKTMRLMASALKTCVEERSR